jgi:hypothetical protein
MTTVPPPFHPWNDTSVPFRGTKTRNGTPGNPSKYSRSTRNEKRIKSPFLCRSVPPFLRRGGWNSKAERKTRDNRDARGEMVKGQWQATRALMRMISVRSRRKRWSESVSAMPGPVSVAPSGKGSQLVESGVARCSASAGAARLSHPVRPTLPYLTDHPRHRRGAVARACGGYVASGLKLGGNVAQ